jgi:hypothetical protein
MNLNYVFGKAFGPEKVSSDELRFAELHIDSQNVEEAIMANSVLVRAGAMRDRTLSLNRLRQICEEGGFYGNGKVVGVFLLIVECFPAAEFKDNPCFASLAYRAAKHPFFGARVNAMRVLRELAKAGDEKATQLLRESVADTHEYVSQAARTALKLAGVE